MKRTTPGPWRVNDVHGLSIVYGPKGERVADTNFYGNPDEIAQADARVIALVPDMLDALRALAHVAVWDDDSDRQAFDQAFALADAVLKKIDERDV